MTTTKHNPHDMLALACELVERAERRGFGVTVIVHDTPQYPGDTCMIASHTSLQSRSAVRGLLAEVLLQCAMRDGVDVDDDGGIGKLVASDHSALYKRN